MNKNNTFLKGTIVLTASGIFVKLLSAVYRIPITRMIGAQGMGHYSATFNVFMPFFSFAIAGITPTVSKLCAKCDVKDKNSIFNIKKKASKCFGLLSLLMSILALITAWIYSQKIESPIIFYGVLIMCPNLIFACFEAIYRGVSQGTLDMIPTAKGSLTESLSKVLIGVSSVYIAGMVVKNNAGEAQLICAFFTVTISGFLCWWYFKENFKEKYNDFVKTKTNITNSILISMFLPISFSALVVSFANFFDTVVCLSIVKNISDYSLMTAYPFISFSAVQDKAMWLFGVYQGLCLSVTNLIPSLAAAVGSRGLPLITKSAEHGFKEMDKSVTLIFKITAAVTVPISIFTSFFPFEILSVLYGDRGAQTELAAYFLKILAPLSIITSFSFPFNSTLHALGKSTSVLKILMLACGVKIAVGTFLCSMDKINIMGCIYSQVVFRFTVFFMSVREIKKGRNTIKTVRFMIVPFVVSYVLASFVRALRNFVLYNLPVVFNTFFCGSIFVVSYVVIMFFTGFFVDK